MMTTDEWDQTEREIVRAWTGGDVRQALTHIDLVLATGNDELATIESELCPPMTTPRPPGTGCGATFKICLTWAASVHGLARVSRTAAVSHCSWVAWRTHIKGRGGYTQGDTYLMIARFRKTLRKFGSEIRVIFGAFCVGRLYGRALKLEKRGKYEKAYAVLGDALESLPDELEPGTTAVATVLSSALTMTVSYSNIAEKLGRPEAAHAAIKKTIRLATPFEFEPQTREYVEWLRSRL